MALFTEIFDDVTKQGRKIQTSDYLKTGLYPIIDQGQTEIAGYTNEKEGLFTDVPAIIFGDHTRILKYVDTPCFLGADGVKLLKAKIAKPNYKYLFYALSSAKIPDTGYSRHFKWLKEVNIPLPPLEEQRRIASILGKVSDLISLRKQQLAKLDELVKSRFVEMFGDPERDPLYEVLSIGDIGTIMTGTTPSMKEAEYYESNDIMFIKPGDIAENCVTTIISSESYISEKARPVGRIFPANTVLVTCIGTIGKVGIASTESSCNQQINVIVPSGKVHHLYLAHALLYIKDHMKDAANAPVVPILNKSDFSKVAVPVPPIDLQEQFAAFVRQSDKSKLGIQQSLDKLETLKKSLMQQYFG